MEMNVIQKNHCRYSDGAVVDAYMKESYHQKRVKQAIGMIEKEVDKLYANIPKESIKFLELGGSTGVVSQIMANKGYNVVLSDIESEPLKIAKQKQCALKTCLVDASKKFPFKDNTFHIIYAGDIIEHLYDTEFFLRECYRCMVDNGILVLTTPNLATLQDRIRFLFGKSPRQVNPNHEFLKLHIRQFTYSMLKETLIINGFKPIEVRTNFIRLRIRKLCVDFQIIAKVFPALGRVLIVSAEKINVV